MSMLVACGLHILFAKSYNEWVLVSRALFKKEGTCEESV